MICASSVTEAVRQGLLQTQLEHDAWATRALIEACAALPDDAFFARFDIGPGSLQKTLLHLVDATFYFADVFNRKPFRSRMIVKNALTPEDLLEAHELGFGALREAIDAFFKTHRLETPLEFPAGSPDRVHAAVALAQIFDHGAHHRAQCRNMLRQLGALGDLTTDPLRWAGVGPD